MAPDGALEDGRRPFSVAIAFSGIDRHHAERVGALTTRRRSHQRLLEGRLVEAAQVADAVVVVREHAGADLQLGEDAEFGVDEVRAGASR